MNLLKIIEITGAIASISAWVLAYTQWNDEGQIKSIVAAITGIILGILAIWAHRVKSKSKVDMLFETLSDELYVEPQPAAKMLVVSERNKYIYNINYPRPFKYLPNLKVECVRGKAEIRILEEKEDHFKLKAIRSTFPILKKLKIRWIAKGELID